VLDGQIVGRGYPRQSGAADDDPGRRVAHHEPPALRACRPGRTPGLTRDGTPRAERDLRGA
jgi:hypothetical protein